MVRIVYDYQTFALQKYGGISRYFYELAIRVTTNQEFEVKVLAFAYLNEYLKRCSPGLVVGLPVPRIPKVQKPLSILSRELSRFVLHNDPPDLLHETFYSSHRLAPKQTRIVTTIHDMMPEKFPEIFGQIFSTEVRRQCIERADHIICVSEHTKQDLIEILDINPSKVSVVYHGPSFEIENLRDLPEPPISDPYILYVGKRDACKNFDRLLNAYALSERLRKDFKLICFGGDPLHEYEFKLAHELGLAETAVIRLTGSDRLLASLYKNASAFVYPSLYEGFGMPLLEAMSLHCPVVCSDASCLPEIAGDAAEYFNPYDPDSIVEAIETVVYSSIKSENLANLGSKRIKEFSWKTCAEKTCDIYRSLL